MGTLAGWVCLDTYVLSAQDYAPITFLGHSSICNKASLLSHGRLGKWEFTMDEVHFPLILKVELCKNTSLHWWEYCRPYQGTQYITVQSPYDSPLSSLALP